MKRNVEEIAKPVRKDVHSDISKLNTHIKHVNKDIDKIKETGIPTV